jgi:DNA-binding CsgD family transcriptional regulator
VADESQISGAVNGEDFGLTPIEREAISLVITGYSAEESAAKIGISEQALAQHLVDIFEKLKVSNHLELMLFAHYYNLIDAVHTSHPAQ